MEKFSRPLGTSPFLGRLKYRAINLYPRAEHLSKLFQLRSVRSPTQLSSVSAWRQRRKWIFSTENTLRYTILLEHKIPSEEREYSHNRILSDTRILRNHKILSEHWIHTGHRLSLKIRLLSDHETISKNRIVSLYRIISNNIILSRYIIDSVNLEQIILASEANYLRCRSRQISSQDME